MQVKNAEPDQGPAATTPEPKHGSLFVEKMFSGFGHETVPPPKPTPPAAGEPYRALRQSTAPSGVAFRLPVLDGAMRVQADSPATDVMTDLARVAAATIPPAASVDEANRVMIRRGVRSLFVVGETNAIEGIITATDVVGERPIQVAQERGLRHAEVLVAHVMTPAAQLEAIDLRDVQQARVGDIVETLKRSDRQHALVIDDRSAERTVCGIFSLTQIARQLGLPPHVGRVAMTFAEIEAAIAR
jgi:CBS domain-containing protein